MSHPYYTSSKVKDQKPLPFNILTQTELGKIIGVNALKMGKELIALGLKDKSTQKATPFALKEKYAIAIKNEFGVKTHWTDKCLMIFNEKYHLELPFIKVKMLQDFYELVVHPLDNSEQNHRRNCSKFLKFWESQPQDIKHLFLNKLEGCDVLSYFQSIAPQHYLVKKLEADVVFYLSSNKKTFSTHKNKKNIL